VPPRKSKTTKLKVPNGLRKTQQTSIQHGRPVGTKIINETGPMGIVIPGEHCHDNAFHDQVSEFEAEVKKYP